MEPEKIPQPHGGALLSGGKPGNRGGRGIPNKVRQLCAEGFAEAIPKIAKIATGDADGVAPNEQVSAFNALGKYGVGEVQSVLLENGEWLSLVAEITAKHMPDAESFEAWFAEVSEVLKMNSPEQDSED